jgi:hypothetical protein
VFVHALSTKNAIRCVRSAPLLSLYHSDCNLVADNIRRNELVDGVIIPGRSCEKKKSSARSGNGGVDGWSHAVPLTASAVPHCPVATSAISSSTLARCSRSWVVPSTTHSAPKHSALISHPSARRTSWCSGSRRSRSGSARFTPHLLKRANKLCQ